MSGLLPRIRRRRVAGASSPAPQPGIEPAAPAAEAPQTPAAATRAERSEPAVAASAERFERPGFRARGQLRRRLRYLRCVRELGLRDIGGLVFDLDRFGRSRDDLVRAKLDALAAIDAELRSTAEKLGEDASFDELREVGIAACPACGALLPSEARFCSACGVRADFGDAAIATSFAVGGLRADDPAAAADVQT